MKTIVNFLRIIVCGYIWTVTLNASHHQVSEDLSDAQRHERSLQTIITPDILQQDAPNTLSASVISSDLNGQALSSNSSHSQFELNAEQYSDIPLTEDSWTLILQPLSQEALLKAGIVSKHFQKITKSIWKGRFLSLSNNASNKDFIAIQKGDFCNLRLINSLNLTIENLKILGNTSALQRLKLCFIQIDKTAAPALSLLTNLTALTIKGHFINNKGIQYLSSLTNLTLLHLKDAFIRTKGTQFLSHLTNLTNLNLKSNNIHAAGTLPLSHLTNLTKLNLSFNVIGEIGIQYLSTLINLKKLNLCCNGISKITNLHPLTNLTKLNLCCNGISETTNLYLLTNLKEITLGRAQLDNLSSLPNLKTNVR